jgi:hypothetical protein
VLPATGILWPVIPLHTEPAMNTTLAPEATVSRDDRERRRIARRRAGARLGLLIHVAVFVAVNAGLLVLDQLTSPQVRWAHYPMLGWGLGLAIHGLVVHAMPVIASLHHRLVERELERMRG